MTKGHNDPTPVTTHRGYNIQYGINSDRWSCSDLNLEADKLSTLKGQIDKAIKVANEGGIPVIGIGGGWGGSAHYGKVVRAVRSYTRLENRPVPGTGRYEYQKVRKIDVYGNARGEDRKSLSKNREITEFAPDNQTTHDMLIEHERLSNAAAAARQKADDYLATIPRLTEADIAEIIEPDKA